MTCHGICKGLMNLSVNALKGSPLVALVLGGMLMAVAPAQAQNGDAWKSAAIIGGSTAAGAIVGYKIAGSRGAYVGAAVGGTAGYAIDQRRRANEYNNGYYGDNGGNYGNNYPANGNGGYDGGSGGTYPYSANYRSSNSSYATDTSYRRR